MSHAPDTTEAGGNRPALSRRMALTILTGGVLTIGVPALRREMRPTGDIVIVDGWVLRTGDLEGMPGVAY